MESVNRYRAQSLVIFAVALLLFTWGIWDQPAQGFDGRWALFLQEMFRHGPSLFPTTYGEPYPDYPGTATYLSYLFARLFGAPNQLANMLPTALASAGVLALLYRLLAPASRAWALLAVILTALTTQWLDKARSVCLDQMIALMCLGAFYLLHSAEQLGSRWRQYGVFPLFVLAFVFRGPLGLIEVCAVVCTYWLLGVSRSQAETRALLSKVLAYGIAGLVLLAGCWWGLMQLARFSGGQAFADAVYTMQVSGRLDDSGEPFYFYFQLSLYRYFPLVPIALATLVALRHRWAQRHLDADLQLALRLGACGLMILLGLSVPHFKRAYYILPMVPMFAALAAYGLLRGEGWMTRVRGAFQGLVAVLPTLAIVVVFVCKRLWHKHDYWPDVSVPTLVGVLLVLQLLVFAVWYLRQGTSRLVGVSLIALVAQWLLLVTVVEPANDLKFDTRTFVTQVEQLRAKSPGPLVFLNLGKDTWAVRYMMNLDHDENPQPLFISADDKAALENLPPRAWVIFARKEQDMLVGTSLRQIIAAYIGRLNNNPLVVIQTP